MKIMGKLCLLMTILILTSACSKYHAEQAYLNKNEPEIKLPKIITEDDLLFHDGETVIGAQLKNPYSVKNMKIALHNINAYSTEHTTHIDIKTTHYYVKFIPESSDELDLLIKNESLILYQYPLDYSILKHGTYYHDPSVPSHMPTYQYASISVEQWHEVSKIGVKYTILDNLFIPKDADINSESIEQLVNKSMILTGNEDNYSQARTCKWTPSGRITSYDDILNSYIPLNGVKVRARRWFTTHIGYTDSKGMFKCNGSFDRPANYSIVWEGSSWNIRGWHIGQAYYNGPKRKGSWDLKIGGGKSLRYATIHRAVYRFCKGNVNGLRRIPNCKYINISYIDDSNDNILGDFYRCGLGVWSDIRIYGKFRGDYVKMSRIFNTTSHELGHAAHFFYNKYNGLKLKKEEELQLIESWANCAAYVLSNEEYKELGVDIDFQGLNYFKQYSNSGHYLPIFVDLIDDFNQGVNGGKIIGGEDLFKPKPGMINSFTYDVIFNMPVSMVQNMAFNSGSITDLKNQLYHYISAKPQISFSQYNLTPYTLNKLYEKYEK